MKKYLKNFYILLILLFLSACAEKQTQYFYTWQGIGPDKWAAVWLINRHIDPEAKIKFVPVNTNIDSATAFDIPSAKYKRTSKISTIASLARAYRVDVSKQAIQDVIQIIHDIEVIAWGNPVHSRSSIVEIAFRDLQKHYGRDLVPSACYIEFFDKLQLALKKDTNQHSATDFQKALMPSTGCEKRKMAFEQTKNKTQLVEELPIREILNLMLAGKKVVFVDAREAAEYDEFHIPNAVNLQLRKVDANVAEQFSDADKVIAYCLKDFRGFELAKALKQKAGIQQAAIMNPYGINGWKTLGLPVTGQRALSKIEAQQQLQTCIKNPNDCLNKTEE